MSLSNSFAVDGRNVAVGTCLCYHHFSKTHSDAPTKLPQNSLAGAVHLKTQYALGVLTDVEGMDGIAEPPLGINPGIIRQWIIDVLRPTGFVQPNYQPLLVSPTLPKTLDNVAIDS
jgi:hypothetical protein